MGLESANSGHIGVRNYGTNPSTAFNFMLRVEGIWDIPCRSVRGFTKENEYELIQEGGVNDYVHMRRKQITKPFSFQVERYVGTEILDPLTLGTDLILPVLLIVFRGSAYGGGLMSRTYVFTGCTVMSKEYGSLDAEKSELMLETTTIAYREMLVLDNPLSVVNQKESWEFDSKNKNGNGNQKAKKNPSGEEALQSTWETAAAENLWEFTGEVPKKERPDMETKASENLWKFTGEVPNKEQPDMEAKAAEHLWEFTGDVPKKEKPDMEAKAAEHLWGFDQQKKAGQGTISAAKTVIVDGKNLTKAETSKKVLEGKSKEWEFNKLIKDGNKIRSAANVKIKETDKKSLEGKADEFEFGNVPEKEASDFEAKSVLWEFSGKKAAGNGKQSANSVAKFLASKK